MGTIVQQAQTMEEKLTGYKEGIEIDFTALEEWRNVRSLLTDKHFEEMLQHKMLTKEKLAFVLDENNSFVANSKEEWYTEFCEVLENYDYSAIDFTKGVQTVEEPFVDYFRKQIDLTINEFANISISEKAVEVILASLSEEIFKLNGKTLATHLNSFKKSHSFKSKDSKSRLNEYLNYSFNSKDSFQSYFKEFPVVARLTVIRMQFLLQNAITLFCRLNKDAEEIKRTWHLEELHVKDLSMSLGDSHDQGNAVSVLNLGRIKLVYKPKNLAITNVFESFLNWFSNASELLQLQVPKGIYRDVYSYNEFIEAKECTNETEVSNYYTRYGQLIAICYLLGVNDLHMENIIACGEHPVIIDIETIFQNEPDLVSDSIMIELIKKIQLDSVNRSLLLPNQDISYGKKNVQISGLDGKGMESTQEFYVPIDIHTDNFRFEKRRGFYNDSQNIPRLKGNSNVQYKNYTLNILDGFDQAMQFTLNNKESMLEQVKKFKGYLVRILLKGTERYDVMLRYANHPNYNQKMKYRERLMMNLWAYPYKDKRVVQSETRDLLYNDIPIFYAYTDSKHLIDSQGSVYENYHQVSGLDRALKCIEKLTQEEIEWQKVLVYSALGIQDKRLNEKESAKKISYDRQNFDFLKLSCEIADRLIDDSFIFEEEQSLITLTCNDKLHWQITPCDQGLYSGLSGLAAYFVELYHKTNQIQYYKNYKRIIHTAVKQAKGLPIDSVFTGRLSPLYPLCLEFYYFGEISEKDYVDSVLNALFEMEADDINAIKEIDYISGLSGIICLLDFIELCFPSYKVKRIKQSLFNRLNDQMKKEQNIYQSAGIAHGLSGIALTYACMGEQYFGEVRQIFSKEYQLGTQRKDARKWCKGVPGMIQARLYLKQKSPECVDEDELNALIQQFKRLMNRMCEADTLCHGNTGIILTLKELSKYSNDPFWRETLMLWLSNIHMNHLFNGYSLPKIKDFYCKGIFDGLGGIGWAYLSGGCNGVSNIMLLKPK